MMLRSLGEEGAAEGPMGCIGRECMKTGVRTRGWRRRG